MLPKDLCSRQLVVASVLVSCFGGATALNGMQSTRDPDRIGRSSAQTAEPDSFYGENVIRTLNCSARNVHTFRAEAGDRVVVHVVELDDFGGICGGACFCFDQCLEIKDETGTQTFASACSPPGNNTPNRFRTILERRLDTDGLFGIHVQDATNNGRGQYTFFLQRVNRPARAELLSLGDEKLFTLARGEVATFAFDGTAGAPVTIEMRAETGTIDPRVRLYDPEGFAIALPEGGVVRETLQEDGRFTILAHSAVDGSGTYRIAVSQTEVPEPADAFFFPQFGFGSTLSSDIVLLNATTTEAPAVTTVQIRDPDGLPLEGVGLYSLAGIQLVTDSEGKISLEVPSSRALTLRTAIPLDLCVPPGCLQLGSVEVRPRESLTGVIRFSVSEYGIAGVPATEAYSGALVPVRNEGEIRTALAIRNIRDQDSDFLIRLWANDEAERSTEVRIPSHGRIASFVDELFPDLAGIDFTGTARIEANDGGVFAAIALEQGPGLFTTLPVSPIR